MGGTLANHIAASSDHEITRGMLGYDQPAFVCLCSAESTVQKPPQIS